MGVVVTVISNKHIHSISLPEKPTGQYELRESIATDSDRLISIEGDLENWILKSNRKVSIYEDNNPVRFSVLLPGKVYQLKESGKGSTESWVVFADPASEDRQTFFKYTVNTDMDITIGRNEQNSICFDIPIVSSRHAILSFKSGAWSIRDDNSTNGTFVNENLISMTDLKPGDTVFIMGLKIIIGNRFIAINNPDGKVRISDKLCPYIAQHAIAFEEVEKEDSETSYFFRSPRFKRDIDCKKFKIDPPPTSPIAEEMPIFLVIGSSIAMGMMSVITITSAVISANITSMIMGFSMLVGTLLIPIITKTYERNRKRKKETLRQTKYKNYLCVISEQIEKECHLQEDILRETNIPLYECEKRILTTNRKLWERTNRQDDFLRVRIGIGNGELTADFSFQERRFTIDHDNLMEDYYRFCESSKILKSVPITYSLVDHFISGIIGKRNNVVSFAKGLIIQLAALYSYDEVKFVFLFDESESDEFEFVKWLPHVWTNDDRFRFIVTNPNEAKEVSAFLENTISTRTQMNEQDLEEEVPYYVIFSFSRKLAQHAEMIKHILANKDNIKMSVIAFYDELKHLPKECSIVVELTNNSGKLFDKDDVSGKNIPFIPDSALAHDPLELSVKLANVPLDLTESRFNLPKMITFLELFGVGKVEHLNARSRWKENDPSKSIEAEIGVDSLGDRFKLDLHERFHGPHGLVAGMTGSGKSEFIISYILSLAVNYHPYEVAFILIDYKGGGMAKSFENLPHTAGIITNLDGAAIKRSLVSIESELKRRQSIFAAAGKKVGMSNIDIYKYQRLFREGVVDEPLQHLFIISDEFAELKTQQPEFMTQLVSAARIGRSLGVHLILATQKPSGVVDDQIWSNSKFRVCLKVQERADSMDMLKRPDAAELTDTGRFYLQVGYNELFEIGQSAWAGAPYYPSDKVQKEIDDSVVVVDRNGHPIKEVKIDRKRGQAKNAKKQLDVITEYLSNIAEEDGIKIRPLWLDPIPAVILLQSIVDKYHAVSERCNLNPVIGEYDDPAHQRQCVLRLPISEEGNVVVYGSAGSGKTSFLNAMIFSLIHEHTPEEVNIYILDFASETLKAFSKAPHVGDVILSYEAEKVSNLFKMLLSETEKRKKLFADYGGDYKSYLRASKNILPSIVVAINNFAAFTEMFEEKEEAVLFLSREGTKYGIYFVLTALGTGGVRFRLLQNFKQLFVLQLNDETDYSSVVGKTDGLFPSKYKGRGLLKRDELYEFQIASLTEEDNLYSFISDECYRLLNDWKGAVAKKVPILPDLVNTEFIKEYVDRNNTSVVPIGVEKNTLNVHMYPFGQYLINMIMSSGNEYQEFICNLASLFGNVLQFDGLFFDISKSVSVDLGTIRVLTSTKDWESEVSNLFDLVLYRNNTYKDSLENGTECEKFSRLTVFINSLSNLKTVLNDELNEKLSLVLEKATLEYNVCFIIADQVKAFSSMSYDKWFKTNVSQNDGIWVGNGITEQYLMKPKKTTSEMHDEITPDFGFSLIRGRAVKLKLLREHTEVDDDVE